MLNGDTYVHAYAFPDLIIKFGVVSESKINNTQLCAILSKIFFGPIVGGWDIPY